MKENLIGKIKKKQKSIRWLILFLASIMSFGNYYCIELPQSLQTYMIQGPMNLSYKDYNLIFTVYSIPNVFMSILGGILIDKIGVRLILLFFITLLLISQILIVTAFYINQFWLILLARFLFGMGGECIQVCYGIIITKHFNKLEISLAFALDATMSQLGPGVSSVISPMLFKISNNKYYMPFLFGLLIMIISWICTFIMLKIDARHQYRYHIMESNNEQTINELFNFKLELWILCFICFFMYGSFYSFTNNANDFIHLSYQFSTLEAGRLMLLLYLTAAFLTPLIGYLTDKNGNRLKLLLFSQFLFLISMIAFLLPFNYSYSRYYLAIFLAFTGIYYSIFSSVFFPCISILVNQNQLGTALGLINAFQALNMAISPLVFGTLKDSTNFNNHSYFYPLLFIIIQTIIAIILTLVLNSKNHKINLFSKDQFIIISPHFVINNSFQIDDLEIECEQEFIKNKRKEIILMD